MSALLYSVAAIVDIGWPHAPDLPKSVNYSAAISMAVVVLAGLPYLTFSNFAETWSDASSSATVCWGQARRPPRPKRLQSASRFNSCAIIRAPSLIRSASMEE